MTEIFLEVSRLFMIISCHSLKLCGLLYSALTICTGVDTDSGVVEGTPTSGNSFL